MRLPKRVNTLVFSLIFAASGLATTAVAQSYYTQYGAGGADYFPFHAFQPYLALNTGMSAATIKGSSARQTLPAGNKPDTFVDNASDDHILYGLAAGLRINTHHPRWFSGFDLDASYWNAGSKTAKGVYTVDGAPIFNDAKYQYQYQVQMHAITLNANAHVFTWHRTSLLLGAGMDFAGITTENFKATPEGAAPAIAMSMVKRTEHKVLYHFNAGLDLNLEQHFVVGVTYRFYPGFHFTTGKINTGVKTVAGLQEKVSLNQVNFHLAYLF